MYDILVQVFRKHPSQEALSCLIVSSNKAPWSCFVIFCFHYPIDRRKWIEFFFSPFSRCSVPVHYDHSKSTNIERKHGVNVFVNGTTAPPQKTHHNRPPRHSFLSKNEKLINRDLCIKVPERICVYALTSIRERTPVGCTEHYHFDPPPVATSMS